MNAESLSCAPLAGEVHEIIAEALQQQGYAIVAEALPPALPDALFSYLNSLQSREFNPAGVGKDKGFHHNPFIRGDEISWLDPHDPNTRAYFVWIENLRLTLNRRLFLGLFDYECHYARYPKGGFYKKHLDAFKGQNSRVVTTVLYLNPNWQTGDGGELQIYAPDSHTVLEKVEPHYGKLIVFLSGDFPHEVLSTNKARFSLTGWFRVNSTFQGGLDPAL